MKEPSPVKNYNIPNVNKELMSVLQEETNNGAAIKMSEGQLVVKEKDTEMRNAQQQDGVEAPTQDAREDINQVLHRNPNIENISIFPPLPRWANVKYLQMDDSTHELTCSIQTQFQTPALEDSVIPAENSIQETAKTVTQKTEIWDEYAAADADDVCGQHGEQAGWHFKVGPGLSAEVQCPLWQFPAMSYYPPVKQTFPFEGENLTYIQILFYQ